MDLVESAESELAPEVEGRDDVRHSLDDREVFDALTTDPLIEQALDLPKLGSWILG
jgi:hypothetical protein